MVERELCGWPRLALGPVENQVPFEVATSGVVAGIMPSFKTLTSLLDPRETDALKHAAKGGRHG